MTPETRAFLDQLDQLLLKNDETADEVSAVITAFRGPDHKKGKINEALKAMTTVPIRRAALPLCAAAYDAAKFRNSMSFRLRDPNVVGVDVLLDLTSGWQQTHFTGHVVRAARVLGLEVKS